MKGLLGYCGVLWPYHSQPVTVALAHGQGLDPTATVKKPSIACRYRKLGSNRRDHRLKGSRIILALVSSVIYQLASSEHADKGAVYFYDDDSERETFVLARHLLGGKWALECYCLSSVLKTVVVDDAFVLFVSYFLPLVLQAPGITPSIADTTH
jgi:hypothetical protein